MDIVGAVCACVERHDKNIVTKKRRIISAERGLECRNELRGNYDEMF